MNEVITLTTAGRRFNMLLLSLLGITGVLLAAVGIYGVVAFFVLQRTHEIGVRMALGATTRDVVRLVMGHSARLTVLGLTTGALGAIAVTRVLTSLLFEIEARDPLTFVAGAGVLATVALAAALLPAHRATRVHPVQSLAVGQ
jgi:ABC-type antimicrobial peptide transport system permease subunit